MRVRERGRDCIGGQQKKIFFNFSLSLSWCILIFGIRLNKKKDNVKELKTNIKVNLPILIVYNKNE